MAARPRRPTPCADAPCWPPRSRLAALPAAAQAPLRLFTAGAGSAFLPYGEGLAAFLAKQGVAGHGGTQRRVAREPREGRG